MAVQTIPAPKGGHIRFWAIVGGSLFMLIAMASILGSQNQTPTPPPATSVAVATPTAEPTVVPTAEPTAVPTAIPTAVPTAVPIVVPAGPSQRELAANWMAAMIAPLGAVANSATAAGGATSIPEMRSLIITALGDARGLQTALRTHPAPAALQAGATGLQGAMTLYIAGMNEVVSGIDNNDAAAISSGATKIGDATVLMTTASDQLTAAAAAL